MIYIRIITASGHNAGRHGPFACTRAALAWAIANRLLFLFEEI